MVNLSIHSTFLRFIGSLKSLQPSDTEIMLVQHQRNISFPLLLSSWDLHSSLSLWGLSMVFSILLTTLMTWLKRSLIHLICGLKKSRNQTNHSISNLLCTMILESMSSKPSFTISTWSLKNSSSINKLHQKCRRILSRIPVSLKSLRSHLTTSSRNVSVGLLTSLLSACIVEYTLQVK